jgi:acetyltransferase-like isoleucine patch superfamily enzyme
MFSSIYAFLAHSEHWLARLARRIRRGVLDFSVPTPHVLAKAVLSIFLAIRSLYYFVVRIFVCEPLFKAYCSQYGKNVHTGVFVHWVQGPGEIILGDNVTVDGKCTFIFASRYSKRARLSIGDGCGIGHACSFTVGREIRIGRNTRIAERVTMFDSPGHSADPEARLAGQPASNEEVRPISIGDNVWIGSGAFIFPGVTIGDGAIVAASAVVMTDVPPNVLVAGNPARQAKSLAVPAEPLRPTSTPLPSKNPEVSGDRLSRLDSEASYSTR